MDSPTSPSFLSDATLIGYWLYLDADVRAGETRGVLIPARCLDFNEQHGIQNTGTMRSANRIPKLHEPAFR